MTALERVLLAADLLEPDALGGAHEHLMKDCPWYRNVSEEKNCAHDPGEHCDFGKQVKLTPRTAEASTVPEPTRPPGGPGLFHVKGRGLPPYIQHLYAHLKAEYGPEKAYGVAVGVVKKWKAGIAPGGKKGGKPRHTHPEVQAAASKNIAQWEQDKADAHDRSREHERGKKAAATVALAQPAATAPGAAPVPKPGPYARPSQTVSPSPPLPPDVKLPTAAEIRKLIGQVPECSDPSLSQSVKNHLDAAAVKLSKDDSLAALHVLRSAQAGVYAAHKADLGAAGPASMTANLWTRVPSAEQSSANAAMIRSRDREMSWRRLEQQVASAIDRIRRKHFHGQYPAGMQQARFSAGADSQGMSSLEKILRLTGSPAAPAEPDPAALLLTAQAAVRDLTVLLASDDPDDDGDDDSSDGGDTDGDSGHGDHATYKALVKKKVPPKRAAAMCAKSDKKVKASALAGTVQDALVALSSGKMTGTAAQAHPPFHGVHSHMHVHSGDNFHGPGPDRMHDRGAY